MKESGHVLLRVIPWVILAGVASLVACQPPAAAPAPDYTAQMNAIVEVWNTGNVDALDTLLTADFVRVGPEGSNAGVRVVGIDSMKAAVLRVRASSEDFTVRIDEHFFGEDWGGSRWTISGTSAVTGGSWEVPGVSITRLRDGKWAEEYAYFDVLAMYQQLGFTLVPPAPPTE